MRNDAALKQKDAEGGRMRGEGAAEGGADAGAGVASCMSESFVSCPFGEIHFQLPNFQLPNFQLATGNGQLATQSASTLKKASAHIRVRGSVRE